MPKLSRNVCPNSRLAWPNCKPQTRRSPLNVECLQRHRRRCWSLSALFFRSAAGQQPVVSGPGGYRVGEAADGDYELVRPLKESLGKVDTKMQELETARVSAYTMLTSQLQSLGTETTNLVKALRTPHTRGQWGEMQLRRAVEMAGMVDYCEFRVQQTLYGEDSRLRPDMVVMLPNGRKLVVDSKAPLAAYLDKFAALVTSPPCRDGGGCPRRRVSAARGSRNSPPYPPSRLLGEAASLPTDREEAECGAPSQGLSFLYRGIAVPRSASCTRTHALFPTPASSYRLA